MAISRTDGIQLRAEINNELSKGDSLGAYRGTFFLHVPSSAALVCPLDKSISFSQLEGFEILPEVVPVTPTIELLTQSNTNVQTNVSPTGTQLLSVMWRSNHSTGMPELLYTPIQNNPLPTTKWYETTDDAWTEITGMSYSNAVGPSDVGGWFNIEVNSSIAVPLSTATTRTFRAVGYTYTSDGTDTKATNTKTLGNDFSITTTVGDAPTPTLSADHNAVTQQTIIHYTSTRESYYPNHLLRLYYQGGFPGSINGYVPTGPDTFVHTIWRDIDGGASVDVTSEFSEGTIQNVIGGTHLSKTENFTTAGLYTYLLNVVLSRNYTDPAGTAVSFSVAAQASQVVNVTVENIDDLDPVLPDPPVLISATINQDDVDEGSGTFTLTIASQDAIGQTITISADETGVVPENRVTSLISSNSDTISFGGNAGTGPGASIIKTSNKKDDRTLTVTVTPSGGDWLANATAKSDTITVKNTGEHELMAGSGVSASALNEGGSFTFTLKGKNLRTTDYTWDTTFPSAAVTATSGSFSTPYAGSIYTGNYDGSFTVDTAVRTTHYEDVTGGQISVYENGVLLTATAPTLQIKNIHAEPVTLPTATANPSHNVFSRVGLYGIPWNGSQDCSVTLGTNGFYTTSSTPQSGPVSLAYATPQPLEGDWIPRITGAGQVFQFVSQEDMYSEHYEHDPYSGLPDIGIYPGGGINATASFSGATATLSVQGTNLTSSIAEAFVAFTWEFYNTSSEEIRAGGTISCNISVSALPTKVIYPPDYTQEKLNCATAGGTWNYTTNECDMPVDPWALAKQICNIAGGIWNPATNECDMSVVVIDTTDTDTDTDNETGTDTEGNFLPPGQFVSSYCLGTIKMGVYADGIGGSYTGVIELNSTSCGYEPTTSTTGTSSTTGSTDPNIEIFVEVDLQAQIQAQLDASGVLDLSNILLGLDLNIDI